MGSSHIAGYANLFVGDIIALIDSTIVSRLYLFVAAIHASHQKHAAATKGDSPPTATLPKAGTATQLRNLVQQAKLNVFTISFQKIQIGKVAAHAATASNVPRPSAC